ncbi:MAG: hypothetical protein ACRCSN_04080 [Dermatophilaceae bacterium]
MTERPGEMDERDIDARFASIVAGWEKDRPATDQGSDDDTAPHDTAPPDTAPQHRSSGDDEDGAAAERGAATAEPAPFVVVPGSAWRTSSSGQDREEDGDDGEEHFEPPAVVLPPQEDLHFWGAVVGLVLGPALLVYVAMVRPFHSARWFAAAVVLTLVGFGLLLLRQPRDRDPTDPDDGARV